MNNLDTDANEGYKLDDTIIEHDTSKDKYSMSGSKHLAHLSHEEIVERRRLQNRKSKQKRRSEFHALYIAKKSNDSSIMGSKVIKPKRSPSGYQLFTMENAAIIKAANPGLPFNEVLSIIGKQWKTASDEIKDPYLNKASQLYNVYVKELEEYHIAVAKAGLNKDNNHMSSMSGEILKDGLSDVSNNPESDDYRRHSMPPCDNNGLLETRIVVESDYVEALKAENIRLLEENNELKRILGQYQSTSSLQNEVNVEYQVDEVVNESIHCEDSVDEVLVLPMTESVALISKDPEDTNSTPSVLTSTGKLKGGAISAFRPGKRQKTEVTSQPDEDQ